MNGSLPLLMVRKMAPSLSELITGPVRSAGFLSCRNAATGPVPFPSAPWHGWQLMPKSSVPRAIEASSAGTGLLGRPHVRNADRPFDRDRTAPERAADSPSARYDGWISMNDSQSILITS